MKNIKRITSCILSALLTLGAVACQKPTEDDVLTEKELAAITDKIPDYSSNNKQFEFYGYASLKDGTWQEGALTYFSGEDFRNIERVKEYKDAGMTILMPQATAGIVASKGETVDFENSKAKEVLDMAAEVGIKMIVTDYRLYGFTGTESIVGEGKEFATEAELDEAIRWHMEPYVNHPAFYGVQLLDEPHYATFTSQGEVYKSIKRCYPDAFVQMNLLPPLTNIEMGEGKQFPMPDSESVQAFIDAGYSPMCAETLAAFELYLTMFLDATGSDYIMYDQYPFWSESMTTYIAGLQVAANVAKTRGVELHFVAETFTTDKGNNTRIMSDADLRWINNMLLGFSTKQIAYFTYFTRNPDGSIIFVDGGSFITNLGQKTDIYYNMQKILAENKAFASTILSFEYQASATYIQPLSMYSSTHVSVCAKGTFAKVDNFESDKESSLLTELYDNANNRHMYMIQNIIDPAYKASTTYQTNTLTFNENYTYAVVWQNAKRTIVKLKDNQYTVSLQPGEAVYVIPFNA